MARARGVAPYHVALKDFLNPPQVLDIDLMLFAAGAGRPVRIRACDDFEVVQVWLSIRTVDEGLIEEGAAVLDSVSGVWTYLTQTQLISHQSVVVSATAADRPAHTASKTAFGWVA